MRKILLALVILTLPANAFADVTYPAADCELVNVVGAINDCRGDAECTTVTIPAGSCNWTGTYINLACTKALFKIEGAGVGVTNIYKTDAISSSGLFYASSSSNINMFEFSGVSLYHAATGAGAAFNMRNIERYRIHDNHFEGYFHNVITSKNMTKGLIDSNTFVNHNDPVIGSYYGISAGQRTEYFPAEGTCMPEVCTCSVGDESWERSIGVSSGSTVIASAAAVIDNSGGSGVGTVRRLYIYLLTAAEGATINVASFTNGGGNTFSYRAHVDDVSVKQGLNVLSVDNGRLSSLAIHNGDYIGIYLNNCTVGYTTGSSAWTVNGDQTDQSSVTFSANIGEASIWGELFDTEGDYAACEAN